MSNTRWLGKTLARLWREALFAARFGLIGLAATAVHMTVVWLLITHTSLPLPVANLMAFLTAFGISFAGNYLWTFGAPGRPRAALRRFFLISGTALALNSLLLVLLTRSQWLPPATAAVAAAGVIPLITYAASRLWGFRVAARPA